MEQTTSLQVASKNSLMLFNQRKQIYLQVATRVPDPSAIQIIDACYQPKMATMDIDLLIDKVSQLRAFLGKTKDVDPAQLRIEATFLQSNYKNESIEDVDTAFNLFINNKLRFQIPEVIMFSCPFIAQVMNAYLRYKSTVIKMADDLAEKDLLLLEQSTTPDQRLQGMIDCIVECHAHSQEQFKSRFFNGITYDFLRKTGRLKLDKDLIEESKKIAEKKWLRDITDSKDTEKKKEKEDKNVHRLGDALNLPPALTMEKSNAIRQYAIDHCLMWYFKKTDLAKLTKSITQKDLE